MENLSQQLAAPSPFAPINRRNASPNLVLFIVCSGVVLASLDLFIVNIALPDIAADLGTTDLGSLSWILNGYAIVYASLLVFFGRLADRHRRNYGFLLGVLIFTLASAACAFATSVGMLVIFRLLQAAGAALLTPTSLGLVLASFSAERRAGAVRIWTATGGLAAALGPVVGGLLVAASWRWVFLVNVPIGIVALVIGWRRLPDIPGHSGPRPDLLGTVLATLGIASLTLALIEGNSWGWTSAATLLLLSFSLALLIAFAAHCQHARNPLIEPELFRARSFTGATLVAIVFSASFGGMLLSVVLWAQNVWHWSAFQSGIAIAPGPLMVPFFAFLVSGRLAARIGAAAVVSLGLVCFGAGLAWFGFAVATQPDYATQMLPGMILNGIGFGLTMPTLMAIGTRELPPASFATGSAVINMMRQTGLAIGVAIFVAVLGTPVTAHAVLQSFQHGWFLLAALSFVAVVPTVVFLRQAREARLGL